MENVEDKRVNINPNLFCKVGHCTYCFDQLSLPKITLIALFYLIIPFTHSQGFFKVFGEDTSTSVQGQMLETKNGDFIIPRYKYNRNEAILKYFGDTGLRSFFMPMRLDKNGNLIHTQEIKLTGKTNSPSVSHIIELTNDTLLFIATTSNFNTNERWTLSDSPNITFIWTDANFNVLKTKHINPDFTDIFKSYLIKKVRFDSVGNLLLVGSAYKSTTPTELLFIKTTIHGDVLFEFYQPFAPRYSTGYDVLPIPYNNNYMLTVYHGRTFFYYLNKDTGMVKRFVLPEDASDEFCVGGCGDISIMPLGGNRFILAAETTYYSRYEPPNNFLFENDLVVKIMSYDGDTTYTESTTLIGKTDTTENPPEIIMDYVDTNRIYVVGTSNFKDGLQNNDSTFSYLFAKNDDYILVSQLGWDSTPSGLKFGTRWVNYFGGDANYIVKYVKATKDGGCIVTGTRYGWDTATVQKLEVFVLKLGPDGNIETGLENNGLSITSNIKIYPNPSSSHFNITAPEQTQHLEIQVINLTGGTVYKDKIVGNKTTLNLSHLPNGIYNLTINNTYQRLVIQR